MTILDTLLFGMVASLVALKVSLLATATVQLVHVLAERTRRHKKAHDPVPVRHQKLDKYV